MAEPDIEELPAGPELTEDDLVDLIHADEDEENVQPSRSCSSEAPPTFNANALNHHLQSANELGAFHLHLRNLEKIFNEI
jgi:hypothetical protein